MQNSLWKLGALLGVIGVGFLVLLKAQNEMTDRQQPEESFNELAAIEELGDLDASDSDQQKSDSIAADGGSAAPSRQTDPAAVSSPEQEPEPTLAIEPRSVATAADDDADAESVNPFADFSAAPSATAQGDMAPVQQAEPTLAAAEAAVGAEFAAAEPEPSAHSTPADGEPEETEAPNPFGPLVDSFTNSSDADPSNEQDEPQPLRADAVDAADPILPVLAEVNAGAAEADPTSQAETIEGPAPTPVAIADAAGESEAGATQAAAAAEGAAALLATTVDQFNPFAPDESSETAAQPEAAPEAAGDDDDAEAAPAPKPFEPTSLTALPPVDSGPTLAAPPLDAADSAEPAEPTLPAQDEPASTAADAAVDAAETQIAQVSGEQAAGGGNDPNPFLVFPGADEPAAPNPAPRQPSEPQPLTEASAAEPMFPAGAADSRGRAWVGDTPRIEVPPEVERSRQNQRTEQREPARHNEPIPQIEPAHRNDGPRRPDADRRTAAEPSPRENGVILPDGTVEMTIMPRNGQPQRTRVRQEIQADVNPFAAAPESADASPTAPSSDRADFDVPPAREATASQPKFPDPGLSFSKGPIQPSAAELPEAAASQSGNGLTSADFVGVGTISPDTPSTPQQAQLTIEKQAPPDAALGQELIYSILVRNVGRSEAKNVVVEDLVPKGTELQGTDPQAHMTPEKKLVWKLGAMSPGASRTIRIKVIPREPGQIGSVATVSFEAAVASRTVITAPQLRLQLDGPQEVRIGEKAPYTFTLTNSGSADASNVYIRNIIPAGFEHPAAQKRNGITDIEYEVGTLRKGESREVELTLLAVEEGEYQNHAILSADGNVNVEAHQGVRVVTSRLTIRREGPANRVVGSQARFTNTLTNESSRPLQGVIVTETIPVGVKFVQASDGGYFDPQQRKVTWQMNTLEPGGVRQLQIVVLAEQAGQLASTVTAMDQQGDQAEATGKLNVAGYSSLTVDVANPARAIPVGEEVALRLKVRNGGTAAASGVETRVKLPPELKFVSARGPVRYAQQGEWIAFEPIDRIDIQGEQTFDIVLAAAAESNDARVEVQLSSPELSKPLSEDESVVIYAE